VGSKAAPDRLAVMAFDPGGTTGVAWGIMQVRDTLAATLQGAELASADITGEYQQQATKLLDLWTTLHFGWSVERQVPADNIHCVSEGFLLRKFGSSDKRGLYPVWISAMFEGLAWDSGVRVRYQEPSTQARSTSARLKRWGAWEVGVSPHRRSAMKHLAFRVNKLI
jgi:hypothetical protein